MSLNKRRQNEHETSSIYSPDNEGLTGYLAWFSSSKIASSTEWGMRIIAELTDWLVPEKWHTPWDLVGKDTFEVMSYLVEPDSVDYG